MVVGELGGGGSEERPRGGGGGVGRRYRRQMHEREDNDSVVNNDDDDDDASLTVELGKMQRQIEAMLERHSRSLEGRISESEQMFSARLTLLETKVHGLDVGSPLRT